MPIFHYCYTMSSQIIPVIFGYFDYNSDLFFLQQLNTGVC